MSNHIEIDITWQIYPDQWAQGVFYFSFPCGFVLVDLGWVWKDDPFNVALLFNEDRLICSDGNGSLTFNDLVCFDFLFSLVFDQFISNDFGPFPISKTRNRTVWEIDVDWAISTIACYLSLTSKLSFSFKGIVIPDDGRIRRKTYIVVIFVLYP